MEHENRITPYVGITGFMAKEEAGAVLQVWPENARRKLMIGVLVSWKTLNNLTNKWPSRYPKIEAVAEIFPDDPRALNLVHYNTKNNMSPCDELTVISGAAGNSFDGFQLNIAWPDRAELASFRAMNPNIFIVLQIGSRAFEGVGDSPSRLAQAVNFYAEIIDHVLLDQSGGVGRPMDIELLRPYLEEISEKSEGKIGLGIAGGMSAVFSQFEDQLSALVQDFPDISVDAEGKLRDKDDNLAIDEAIKFARESLRILEGIN